MLGFIDGTFTCPNSKEKGHDQETKAKYREWKRSRHASKRMDLWFGK